MSAVSVSFELITSFSKKETCIIVEVTPNTESFQNVSVTKKTRRQLQKQMSACFGQYEILFRANIMSELFNFYRVK